MQKILKTLLGLASGLMTLFGPSFGQTIDVVLGGLGSGEARWSS